MSVRSCRSLFVSALLALLLGPLAEAAGNDIDHLEVPAKLLHELATSLAKDGKSGNFSVNVNDHIDDNIEYIRSGLKEVDPKDLRDIKHILTKKIYTLLYSGWLQHLSELKRSGDCLVRYGNKVLNVDLNFEWNELLFNYRYLIKFFFLLQRGDVYGSMKEMKINISLDVDFKTYQIALKRLHFDSTKRVKVWLEGQIFHKIYNLFLSVVTKVAKKAVLKKIQSASIELIELDIAELNKILGKHKLPVFTFVNLADMNLEDDSE